MNWNITVAPARATCIDAVAACNCASHLNLLRCYCILSTLKWDNIYFANYFHWNNYVGLFMKPIHQLSMVYWSLLFTCCHGYGYGRNLLKQLHSVACCNCQYLKKGLTCPWQKANSIPQRWKFWETAPIMTQWAVWWETSFALGRGSLGSGTSEQRRSPKVRSGETDKRQNLLKQSNQQFFRQAMIGVHFFRWSLKPLL